MPAPYLNGHIKIYTSLNQLHYLVPGSGYSDQNVDILHRNAYYNVVQ